MHIFTWMYVEICGDNQSKKNQVKIGTLRVVLRKVHPATRLHYHQSSNFKMDKNRKCTFPRHEMNPSLVVTRRFVMLAPKGAQQKFSRLRSDWLKQTQARAMAWCKGKWSIGRWGEDCRGGQGRAEHGRKWVDASSTLTQTLLHCIVHLPVSIVSIL